MTEDRDRPEPAETFESLQSLLLNNEEIETFLQEVAELAAGVVTPAASCGITTSRDGRYYTAASSDDQATKVDETQYDSHQGPCLHALDTGEVVEMPDVGADTRWPEFSQYARTEGLRSALTMPLVVREAVVGVMNVYSFHLTRAFDALERQRLDMFAGQASAALALALRQAQANETNTQLEEALGSRTIIDQALGILMGQQRCTAEDAFALLRTHSQNNNRKLRDVAAELVARTSGQSPNQSPPFGH